MINSFSPTIIRSLRYYIYLYLHPLTKEIFYVGKGKGNRVFSHLKDESESDKVKMINEIKSMGKEPEIEILIHGLEDEETALRVEAAVIDLLEKERLTNQKKGWRSGIYGRMSITQIKSAYEKEPVEISDKCILIRINQQFRYSMSPIELYDYTRSEWRLNKSRAEKAQYALAVYEGVIQEVYSIKQWFKAGETFNIKDYNDYKADRFEFIGNLAPKSIRQKYRYKSVEQYFPRGSQNPITYVNC